MSNLQAKIPKKVDLRPKKHHGFHLILVLFGIVMPPIAVALRFGVCKDLWINIFLTICGYIPSHVHNFYIQNIRNNENRGRTPKWALKAGVIDTDNIERRKKKNAWAGRYDERNLQSTHVGQALEEGEEGDNYAPQSEAERERLERRRHEGLWGDDDEEYYNDDRRAPNQRHWHYPANFEGTDAISERRRDDGPSSRQSVDSITGASAYPTTGGPDDDVPEWGKDYGAANKKSGGRKMFSRKKSNKQTVGDWADNGNANGGHGYGYADDVARDDGWSGANGRSGGGGGGGGGGRSNGSAAPSSQAPAKSGRNGDPNWEHEF